MENKWFVQINGKKKGPYTFLELKKIKEITPDTLVWSKNRPKWTPIRYVPELKDLFREFKKPSFQEDEASKLLKKGKQELAIELRRDPPLLFWVLIALLIFTILYHIYQT